MIIVLKRIEIVPNPLLKEYENKFIYLNDYNPINISSTEIRNGNYNNIDKRVVEYIKDHNLYEV